MSHNIRHPETSKKNPFWITKERYYELKHFCLQYLHWRKLVGTIGTIRGSLTDKPPVCPTNDIPDPVMEAAAKREFYVKRIEMIENAAYSANSAIANELLIGVTQGVSYEILNARDPLPVSKDEYYKAYRKFFWILDKARQ